MLIRVLIVFLSVVSLSSLANEDTNARLNGVADYLLEKHNLESIRAVRVSPTSIAVTEILKGGNSLIEKRVQLDDSIFHQVGSSELYDWRGLNTRRFDDRKWQQSQLVINYLEKY